MKFEKSVCFPFIHRSDGRILRNNGFDEIMIKHITNMRYLIYKKYINLYIYIRIYNRDNKY
jgi:hypothetical protein